uniref:Uncharacterized protein n=1 Tax=Rhodosorus marinus TaxID=101924 RepID=A0A7S2ZBV8_9RHOD|mmetsp:Transcript_13918/g.56063  ORF Transcript_13918/g.56063 Transcript_13918/m.56063 type:complete len:270 (+) Transcript_13918:461-1270(+)
MGKKGSSALDYGDLFGENGFNIEALERAKAKEAAAQKKRAELRRQELRKKKQGSATRPSKPFVSEGRSGLSVKAEQAQFKAQEARRKLEEKKRHKEEKMQLANMKPKDVRASSKHKSSWEKIQSTIDPKSRPRKDDTRVRKVLLPCVYVVLRITYQDKVLMNISTLLNRKNLWKSGREKKWFMPAIRNRVKRSRNATGRSTRTKKCPKGSTRISMTKKNTILRMTDLSLMTLMMEGIRDDHKGSKRNNGLTPVAMTKRGQAIGGQKWPK